MPEPKPETAETPETNDRRPETAEVVIETRGLTKTVRGGQLAVDSLDLLDLSVPDGSVFGSAAWACLTAKDISA
jgi:hypothetical protein